MLVFIDDADCLDEPSSLALASATMPIPPIVIVCNDYWSRCLRPLHSRIGPRSYACVCLQPVTGHHLSNLKTRLERSGLAEWTRGGVAGAAVGEGGNVEKAGKEADAARAEWKRRLPFEVNGDIRQYMLRLTMGPMTTGKDEHFDSIFSRVRFLTSESKDQAARSDAYSDMCIDMLFETFPKMHMSDDGMDSYARTASAFSALPCNKHGFYGEEAEFVVSNLLHSKQKIMPVFPRQMIESSRRSKRKGAKPMTDFMSCLA